MTKLATFVYDGGTNPGSTRTIFIDTNNSSQLSGVDLACNEYRNFSKHKVRGLKLQACDILEVKDEKEAKKVALAMTGARACGEKVYYNIRDTAKISITPSHSTPGYIEIEIGGDMFKLPIDGYNGLPMVNGSVRAKYHDVFATMYNRAMTVGA